MSQVQKLSLNEYVSNAYDAYIKNNEKPIENLKLAEIAKGFFKANNKLPDHVVKYAKALADRKVEYYERATGGSFRKFFSAIKNIFKFGEFSSTAVIVKKSIKAYEDRIVIKNTSNVKQSDIITYLENAFGVNSSTTKLVSKLLSLRGVEIKGYSVKKDVVLISLDKSFEGNKIILNKDLRFKITKDKKDKSKDHIEFYDDCVTVKTKHANVYLKEANISPNDISLTGGKLGLSKTLKFTDDQLASLLS